MSKICSLNSFSNKPAVVKYFLKLVGFTTGTLSACSARISKPLPITPVTGAIAGLAAPTAMPTPPIVAPATGNAKSTPIPMPKLSPAIRSLFRIRRATSSRPVNPISSSVLSTSGSASK